MKTWLSDVDVEPDIRPALPIFGWLALAWVAGYAGLVARLRPPAPQVLVLALTAAVLVYERVAPWQRRATALTNLRGLVALHICRVIGIEFLWAMNDGLLPRAFAVPAALGDIAVALGALVLVLLRPPATGTGRWLYLSWNTVGLLDLLFVVGSAARFALADPGSMAAMLRLPLSILPTFVVPLLLSNHVFIYRRLLTREAAPA